MKTIIVIVALLICGIASANDWDVLQSGIERDFGIDIGPQSSMSERYDPPTVVYVQQDSTPSMPRTTTNPYE